MRITYITFLSLLVNMVIFSNAAAQNIVEKYGNIISDEEVKPFISEALSHIHTFKCGKTSMCRKSDEKEKENPPISIIEGRAAMAHGIASALATWCGFDFKRSFLPMIAFGKHKKGMNTRQLVLMTWIHGTFSGMQLKFYIGKGQCPQSIKHQIDMSLPQ